MQHSIKNIQNPQIMVLMYTNISSTMRQLPINYVAERIRLHFDSASFLLDAEDDLLDASALASLCIFLFSLAYKIYCDGIMSTI